MELIMEVRKLTLAISYDFDKSLLLYREYPPDANHGFDVEPAVISVLIRTVKKYMSSEQLVYC